MRARINKVMSDVLPATDYILLGRLFPYCVYVWLFHESFTRLTYIYIWLKRIVTSSAYKITSKVRQVQKVCLATSWLYVSDVYFVMKTSHWKEAEELFGFTHWIRLMHIIVCKLNLVRSMKKTDHCFRFLHNLAFHTSRSNCSFNILQFISLGTDSEDEHDCLWMLNWHSFVLSSRPSSRFKYSRNSCVLYFLVNAIWKAVYQSFE